MHNIHINKFSDYAWKWVRSLDEIEGWKDYNRKKLLYALHYNEREVLGLEGGIGDFDFDETTTKRHAIVMCFYELQSSLESLRSIEFYFRRYPFRGLPITHYEHLTYVCELYFNRFYEFKERLKNLGNAIKDLYPDKHWDVGHALKAYERRFKLELSERNKLHHHGRFGDLDLDRIRLTHSLSTLEDRNHFKSESMKIYRQYVREWVERVRNRSLELEKLLNEAAELSLEYCKFLHENTSLKLHTAKARSDTSPSNSK